MGKIYDNWGMLVKAVLRREHDRQLAMCHSRDHSIISDGDSSTRFSFSFDTCLFFNQLPDHSMMRYQLLETNKFLGVDHYYNWDTTSPLDHVAIARIKAEFQTVFSCHTTSPIELTTESTKFKFSSEESNFNLHSFNELSDSNNIHKFNLIPPAAGGILNAVNDLRGIAERMIAEGFLREYVQVYASVRKAFMDASWKKLNVDALSIGDIERLEWETLETMIWRWTKAAKMCVRVLFSSERMLCKNLFVGLGNATSAEDVCFMEIVKGSAIQLFSFADAVSISKLSPERLFKILVLHDTLSELLPDVESVFDSKFGESIRIWVLTQKV